MKNLVLVQKAVKISPFEARPSFFGIGTDFPAAIYGRKPSAQKLLPSALTGTYVESATVTIEPACAPLAANNCSAEPRINFLFYPEPSKLLTSFSSVTRHYQTWMQELLHLDFDYEFILKGIANGFHIVPDISIVPPAECENYPSATNPIAKPLLDALFGDELAEGKLLLVHDRPRRVHAIGAVPKKGSDTLRPITDCSRPLNCSLNSFISCNKFSFDSLDDVVKSSSPNCFYSVVDIQAAYRSVPVHPDNWTLQWFKWSFDGESFHYFVDRFLCFGLSNAPKIFQRVSTAIARIMRRKGFVIVSYLDDFLVIAPTEEDCREAQQTLIRLLVSLGFAVKWPKVVGPAPRVQFLGLIVDSSKQCLELPSDKLETLKTLARNYSRKSKLSKKELEVIVGHMSFASKAVFGARTFTRIFIDAMHRLRNAKQHTRVTKLLRAELHWWENFAASFNGLCYCPMGREWPVKSVSTDASFSGFGALCGKMWLVGTWEASNELLPEAFRVNRVPSPKLHLSLRNNINFLELIAACIPLLILAPRLAGHKVIVLCDNTQSVSFLNRGTTKNLGALVWLKYLFENLFVYLFVCTRYGFRIIAVHSPGAQNILADALSRLSESEIFQRRYFENSHQEFPGPPLPVSEFCSYPAQEFGS